MRRDAHPQYASTSLLADIPAVMAVHQIDRVRVVKTNAQGQLAVTVGHAGAAAVFVQRANVQPGLRRDDQAHGDILHGAGWVKGIIHGQIENIHIGNEDAISGFGRVDPEGIGKHALLAALVGQMPL